jgi:uncharacterized membrane protein
MNWKTFFNRLKNPATIVTLAALLVLILTTVGLKVDNDKVMTVIKAICSIGTLLGVLNNPDTPGLDLPGLPPDTTGTSTTEDNTTNTTE